MTTAAAQRDIRKVLVGTVDLWLAPADTVLPADSVNLGGDWGTVWKHPGFTEEGVAFTFDRDTEMHRVEEQSNPAFVTVSESDFSVALAFAEDTLENMKRAFGGGTIAVVSAGSGIIGKSTLTLSDDLEFMALGLEGKNPDGHWRRIYIPRVVSTGSVETPFRRNESKRLYPAEFHAICGMDEIKIVNKDAVALA